jgi:peptidoglycan/LPS O-acetylase OafA/YrhL
VSGARSTARPARRDIQGLRALAVLLVIVNHLT